MPTTSPYPDPHYPDSGWRLLITASTMLAAIMVTLDSTIANVALPHIQSTLAASPEQVIWVVTSYVIATAIATPLAGWLASRYGRKYVMAGTVTCFTIASAACGDDDPGTPAAGNRQIAELIPGASYREVASARHIPMVELPEVFAGIMLEWLDARRC